MTKIHTSALRVIVEDFQREILARATRPKKPDQWVINFRNEQKEGTARDIWLVPLDLLRFRKDNGRISSDVITYERLKKALKEDDKETQEKLAEFLENKDPEKTRELLLSIQHEGQREPAIITCDGFLINGNRRKLALQKLRAANPGKDEYNLMRVVILPGPGEPGGPPTLAEIEQIENRYQLQSDGKAEYYKFDRALSIRRKIDLGISLEEQLRDDPTFAALPQKEFEKKVNEYRKEYLKPLACIDKYLSHLDRDGLYDTISSGGSDPEGRWQAFLDYSAVFEQLQDPKKLAQMGLKDREVGYVEDVAFKLIRKRDLSVSKSGQSTNLPKVHKIMRDLPKLLRDPESKKALLSLKDLPITLPKEQQQDKESKEYGPREIDKYWGEHFATELIRQLKKSYQIFEHGKDKEGPLVLLREALEKLNDINEPSNIGLEMLVDALTLSRQIRGRAEELEHGFYNQQKEFRRLANKGRSEED